MKKTRVKRRWVSQADAIADTFHDVKLLFNRLIRRGVEPAVSGRALLIGAALAAYDAGLDDLDFSDNALHAFAIAEAIRAGKETAMQPVYEPESEEGLN